MNRSKFWSLIDRSRREARGHPGEQRERLRAKLEGLKLQEIVEFGQFFEEYSRRSCTWGLRAAALIIKDGCTDETFHEFRGWLISRGEFVYLAAIEDPDSLARILSDDRDCEYEDIHDLASQAWQSKMGASGLEYPGPLVRVTPARGGESGSEKPEDLKQRFPRLWRKFAVPPPRYIEIAAVPPGEAPLEIRKAWIGCRLPLLEGRDGPQTLQGSGVLSGQPEGPGLFYPVLAGVAVALLELEDREAAEWWKQNTPHLLQPGRFLAFPADVCVLLAPSQP